jgi:hypothetical protein
MQAVKLRVCCTVNCLCRLVAFCETLKYYTTDFFMLLYFQKEMLFFNRNKDNRPTYFLEDNGTVFKILLYEK